MDGGNLLFPWMPTAAMMRGLYHGNIGWIPQSGTSHINVGTCVKFMLGGNASGKKKFRTNGPKGNM